MPRPPLPAPDENGSPRPARTRSGAGRRAREGSYDRRRRVTALLREPEYAGHRQRELLPLRLLDDQLLSSDCREGVVLRPLALVRRLPDRDDPALRLEPVEGGRASRSRPAARPARWRGSDWGSSGRARVQTPACEGSGGRECPGAARRETCRCPCVVWVVLRQVRRRSTRKIRPSPGNMTGPELVFESIVPQGIVHHDAYGVPDDRAC